MTVGTAGVIAPAAWWRLAVIFDAPDGDRQGLRRELKAATNNIHTAAQGGSVRIGTASFFMNDLVRKGQDYAGWRTNDAAVEVTVGASRTSELPAIAARLRTALEPMIDMTSVEVMSGPTYMMLPPRLGDCVLSLSFRRDPARTKQEFSRWWYYQHAGVAIPVMGDAVLAYDQVHCDDETTGAVSDAFGVPAQYYDAYDNLTWANLKSFLEPRYDPEGSQRIGDDEIGWIDNDSRRHAILEVLV